MIRGGPGYLFWGESNGRLRAGFTNQRLQISAYSGHPVCRHLLGSPGSNLGGTVRAENGVSKSGIAERLCFPCITRERSMSHRVETWGLPPHTERAASVAPQHLPHAECAHRDRPLGVRPFELSRAELPIANR